MEYIYNMYKYDQLKDSHPSNIILKICVDMYELCLREYMITGIYRYKLDMDVISSIIKRFISIEEDMYIE